MKLAILANDRQKEEWLLKPMKEGVYLIWVSNHQELQSTAADAYFDLLFQPVGGRIDALLSLNAPVFLNEVIHPFSSLIAGGASPQKSALLRLNAWPTFLKREIIELSSFKEENIQIASSIFSKLGWKFKAVPDIPGLLTARVISMIINEAYYTLQDEVSTKKEIDVAMKLGTNYPYGPFEWSELIGLPNIYKLLIELSGSDSRYTPCELLIKETEQQSAWH